MGIKMDIPSSNPRTIQKMLLEMQQALSDEIERQGSFRQIKYSAVEGKLLSEGNKQYTYQFTLLDSWEPQDDTPAIIENSSVKGARCTVVNAKGTFIILLTEEKLPPDILQQIDLSDDSTALLKRLKEALEQIDEGSAKLGSKCFGLLPYREDMYSYAITFGNKTPHEKQSIASRLALGGEITFVIGPPGTGKTVTLAAIALEYLRTGHTVLIAAQTNIAIDNAIMGLCELCKETGHEALLTQGQVVRYGAVQEAKLKNDDRYKEVYLPKMAKARGIQFHEQHEQYKFAMANIDQSLGSLQQRKGSSNPLEIEYRSLQTQIASLQSELQPLELIENTRISTLHMYKNQYTEYFQNIVQEERVVALALAKGKAQIEELRQTINTYKQDEQAALARLVEVRAMSRIKLFFKRIKPEHIEMRVAELSQQEFEASRAIESLYTTITEMHERLSQCKKHKQDYENSFTSITAQLNAVTNESKRIEILKDEIQIRVERQALLTTLIKQDQQKIQSEYKVLQAKRTQLEENISAIEQHLRDIEKSLVENARVVGTTLSKTYMSQIIINRRFTAVILDEVSMASLPLIYIAASHADSTVTLIGDPQQLSPIVMSKTKIAKKWLGEHLFDYRSVTLETAIAGKRHSTMLDIQSRMHPAISDIVKQHVYRRYLTDDPGKEFGKLNPSPDSPLILCDTSDASPIASKSASGSSRRNYYHALCCIAIARQILDLNPEMKKQVQPDIGIVTPYRPQAQLLNNLIKEAKLQQWVQASTIHRFQGLEFKAIIFDTVQSPGLRPGEFLSGSYKSATMRLINVAVTRAKQKLVIVANFQYISQNFSVESTLYHAVDVASKAAIIPSLDIVGTPFTSLVWKALEQTPSLSGPTSILNALNLDEAKVLVQNSLQATDKDAMAHLTEETFYEAFKQDIRKARKDIVIASPFSTKVRVDELLPLLLEQKKKGVSITVLTKPLAETEPWNASAINTVQASGIKVMFRPEMHEKVVVIDKRVLYHGSLNPLSQRKSLESMLRITAPHIIEAVSDALQRNEPPQFDDNKLKNLRKLQVSLKQLPHGNSPCTCGSALVSRLNGQDATVFYGCARYQKDVHKGDREDLSQSHIEQVQELQNQVCSRCSNHMSVHLQRKPQRIILMCDNQCGEALQVVFTKV